MCSSGRQTMQNDRTLTNEELFYVEGGVGGGGHVTGGGNGTGGHRERRWSRGRNNMTMGDWINWFVYQGTPHSTRSARLRREAHPQPASRADAAGQPRQSASVKQSDHQRIIRTAAPITVLNASRALGNKPREALSVPDM